MTDQPPQSLLPTARVIAGALPTGVVLFWGVAWFFTDGGRSGLQPELVAPRLAFWAWSAVALVTFAAALMLRGKAVGASAVARSRAPSGAPVGSQAQVQAHLIVAWGLLEVPALLAGVIFMLLAYAPVLSVAALVYGIGVAITFPRAEWFGEGGRSV